jgi:hypothetical protein
MGAVRGKRRRLSDGFRFEGFRPQDGKVRGKFGGAKGRILPLERRSKKQFVDRVEPCTGSGTTARLSWYETCPAGTCKSTLRLSTDVWTAGCAAK